MAFDFLQSDSLTLTEKARAIALLKLAYRGTDEDRAKRLADRREYWSDTPGYPWYETLLVGERVAGHAWCFWTDEEKTMFVNFINTTDFAGNGVAYCRRHNLHLKLDPYQCY